MQSEMMLVDVGEARMGGRGCCQWLLIFSRHSAQRRHIRGTGKAA